MATGVPDPPALVSPVNPLIMLLVFGATAVAAFGYAVVVAFRRRDPLPVAACFGAMACALNEPIYDILGKIVYARNHAMAFSAFGRDIPWFLVIGYIAWVGLLPYLISRAMAVGMSRGRLHLIAVAGVLSVVLVEVLNLWLKAWEYYGEAPLKFFGGVAAMAGVPVVGGFVIYAVGDRLRGWRRALAGFVIPTLVLPMVFASTGWPLYIALYSNLPKILDYAAVVLLCALIVATVCATTAIAQRWREGQLLLAAGDFKAQLGQLAPSENQPTTARAHS
jgi:hypothetical protein